MKLVNKALAAFALIGGLVVAPAQAAVLFNASAPDYNVTGLTSYTYNAATNEFSYDGVTSGQLVNYYHTQASFDSTTSDAVYQLNNIVLSMSFDEMGNFDALAGSTFSVDMSTFSGGPTPGPNPFAFTTTVADASWNNTQLYVLGANGIGGIFSTARPGNANDFTAGWNVTGQFQADITTPSDVPVFSPLVLMAAGFLGLGFVRRKQS